MTRTYTAADFANARFAEHPDGRLAVRDSGSQTFPWRTNGDGFVSDGKMPDFGWVPVFPARTIHDRDVEALCIDTASYERDDYLDGFIRGFQKAGGVILDDPEPTNAEKLADILVESFNGMEFDLEDSFREIAAVLDKHGVKVED